MNSIDSVTVENRASIALRLDQWRIEAVHRTLLYERLDFLTNARGENDGSTLRSLRLMRTELDLASSLAVLIDDIADGQCGNLANTQSGIDGKYESETISLGVSSGFDDAKHASNIVFRED